MKTFTESMTNLSESFVCNLMEWFLDLCSHVSYVFIYPIYLSHLNF